MARNHVVNEGSAIPVYAWSSLNEDSRAGTLYNGEVFTLLEEHSGYQGVYEIRYLNSSGAYTTGFILGTAGGNLAYYGTRSNLSTVGACYCFKLNTDLDLVNNLNRYVDTLSAGDYVYTKSATAGASNPLNMGICSYRRLGGSLITFDGFLTLDYTKSGSMINKNFCIGA